MWLERKRFPALELGPDEGIIAITTGVKADDLGDQKKEEILHNRVFDESTLRICMESAGFIKIAPVDNHEAMVAPSSVGPGLATRARRLQTDARLRTEGRVRRQRSQRSQDVGNTLRAGVAASV